MPEIDFAARRPWLEDFFERLETAGGRILIVDVEGRPAGFTTVDTTRATVDQLAVGPAWQGRGVASRLLSAAKGLCPDGLELVVNRDNEPARRLYRHHGFVDGGEATNPTSGLATLTMTWNPALSKGAAP